MKRSLFFIGVLSVATFGCSNGPSANEVELERLKLEREKLEAAKQGQVPSTPQNDQGVVNTPMASHFVNTGNVSLRSDHTVKSERITVLKQNTPVVLIDSYVPEGNGDEAILRQSTDFYDNSMGYKLFSLGKGKAVIVGNYDGTYYSISYKDDRTGNMGYARITPDRLEFIGGEDWKLVEVEGKRGWILGKYVSAR
jgi:hypothetical protein